MGRIIAKMEIDEFSAYLKSEERSENTVEKYLRDVRIFAAWLDGREITKERVIAFKQQLIEEGYAARSVNSMLASLNSLFDFIGWCDCRVKTLKVQKQDFCTEERELTKAEYERLCKTAQSKHNERLNLILQTLCGNFRSESRPDCV